MKIEKYLNKEEIEDICIDVESFIFLRIKEDLHTNGKYNQEFVSELVNDILRKMYFLD